MPLRRSASNNSRRDRASARPRLRFDHGKRQGGAFALVFVSILMAILAFCGLALDLGAIYNRKVELHGMAKAVALAAARELNGTSAGVTAALAKAKQTGELFHYQYKIAFTWSDAAIKFSPSPSQSAAWVDAATASGDPSKYYYVQVNTDGLDSAAGTVSTVFMQLLSGSLSTVHISDHAIAGRTAINVVPLAVCAMGSSAGELHPNSASPSTKELMEWGFRRGVTYNLMELNPGAMTARNYVIDPTSPPGSSGTSSNTSASVVGPFVCTGTMWMPRVTGGSIHVSSPFPLASLYQQLNSRFDQYNGNLCSPNGAPPDFNVRQYAYDTTNTAPWMNPTIGSVSTARWTNRGRDETIADPPLLPGAPSGGAGSYGPLWSYAKAAKLSSYTPGVPEPTTGYATFATTDWSSLYQYGPSAPGYPTSSSANTPYKATSGTNYKAPSAAHLAISVEQRRVLNVPLLDCGATGTGLPSTVLGIGKFFMTVPATDTRLIAEFGGLVPEQALTGRVELYP